MTIQDITSWLKDSVPGIILLGAIGSLLAVVIGHILKPVVLRIIPEPIKQHRKRMTKQAFMLGFSAAIIEDDETGKYLVAFLIFHLCKIVLCVGFVLALCWLCAGFSGDLLGCHLSAVRSCANRNYL